MVYYLSFIVLYSYHHAPRIFRHNPMFFFIIFNRVSQGLSSFSTGFLRVYHHFQPGFSGFIMVFNRVSTGFIMVFNRVSQGLSSFSTGFQPGLSSFSTGFLRVYHHFQPGFSGFIRVYHGFPPFFTYLNDLSSGHFFLFFLVIGSPRSVLAKVEPWDEVMAGASEILNHAEGALGSAGSRWAQVM